MSISEQSNLIDDSYNANPASMEAAIDVLTALSKKLQNSAILVVGDMAELGVESIEFHRHIGRYAAKRVFSFFALLGSTQELLCLAMTNNKVRFAKFSSKQALAKYLLSDICGNSLVLVKVQKRSNG